MEQTFVVFEAFSCLVNMGQPVPPKLLQFIAVGIRRYIDACGRETLEQAFNLHSRQRAGSPAKWWSTRQEMNRDIVGIARTMQVTRWPGKTAFYELATAGRGGLATDPIIGKFQPKISSLEREFKSGAGSALKNLFRKKPRST